MSISWLFYPVYATAVGILAYQVGENAANSNKAHSVAAYAMSKNHFLQPQDLAPIDSMALVGHYLRHDVKQASAIAPTDVSPEPVFTKQPNVLAAIVTVSRDLARTLQIKEGGKVVICRNGKPLSDPVTVLALACDESGNCSLTAALPKIPSQVIDPDTLADATIAAVGRPAPCTPTTL